MKNAAATPHGGKATVDHGTLRGNMGITLQRLLRQHLATLAARRRRAVRGQKASGVSKLSDNAEGLLKVAASHRAWPVKDLWKILGRPIAPATQIAIRKELANRKFAKFAIPRFGKHPCLLIEVADSGFDYLGRQPNPLRGQGNPDTKNVLSWILEREERRGFKAKIEGLVSGTNHRTDVLTDRNGTLHAFELCMHIIDNIVDHLTTCLLQTDAIATVIIVTPDLKVQKKIKAMVQAELSLAPVEHRIKYELVETFKKELFG